MYAYVNVNEETEFSKHGLYVKKSRNVHIYFQNKDLNFERLLSKNNFLLSVSENIMGKSYRNQSSTHTLPIYN